MNIITIILIAILLVQLIVLVKRIIEMRRKPIDTPSDFYSERAEFVKNELKPLLVRLKTQYVTSKENGYRKALTIAEEELADGDIAATIGRLESICSMFADHDVFREAERRIKSFIDDYDNFAQRRWPEHRYARQAKMIENTLKIEKMRSFIILIISLLSFGTLVICAFMGKQTVVIISTIGACISLVVAIVHKNNLPSLINGLVDVINKNGKSENPPSQ